MLSAVTQTPHPSPYSIPNDREVRTWQDRTWEIGKEIALTAIPFLTLYKPFSFPVALGMGALRVGLSAFQLADAIREGDSKRILSEFIGTAVAVISLAGTIFAHPIGLLISTVYDLILELHSLVQHLREGKYIEALQSCLKITGYCLYLAVFLYGGPEVMICFFAVQILIGILEARHELAEGRYIAGIGHALMSIVSGGQLVGQIKTLQMKLEIQRLLNDPVYVGKLAEKWQFPSDHLPVGAKVGNAHVISWNILNDHFIGWITEKDSQGLNGSLITELHEKKSLKYPGLTMRDELVMAYLLQMINNPSHNSHLILNLQECSPEFIRAFSTLLPSNMGMILSDKSFSCKDQNIVIYNRENFTYLASQSSLPHAFPNTDPRRILMDLIFVENATQEKYQVINAHLPGDPENHGIYDFARYVLTHFKSDCTTIALGDMNFTEPGVQDVFNKEAAKLNIQSPFKNLSKYHTNIGPYKFYAKGIDHILVNSTLPCESMAPNEVLEGLQSSVDLLHSHHNAFWQTIEALRLEFLKKIHQAEILAKQLSGSAA